MRNRQGGTLFGRHALDANNNAHALSLMWHVAAESEAPWAEFDTFLHQCIPHLRSQCISIIMYACSRRGCAVVFRPLNVASTQLPTGMATRERAKGPARLAHLARGTSRVLTRTVFSVHTTDAPTFSKTARRVCHHGCSPACRSS